MNRHMTHMCETVFSYFDTGKGPMGEETERFYHGFVLGMVVSMSEENIKKYGFAFEGKKVLIGDIINEKCCN